MVRRVLLDFLLEKHRLHIHQCFDDAWLRPDTGPYNGLGA